MSSRTSTRRASVPAPVDTGFRPWHLYVLLSMIAATAAVMMARQTHPVALLVLSGAVIAAGLVGLAVHRALSGFAGREVRAAEVVDDRTRDGLLADKALILRSIKELEFDHAMKKISDADFQDMNGRLRLRALTIMEALERGTTSTPAIVEAAAADDDRCASCGTPNDEDAKFCKHCGHKL